MSEQQPPQHGDPYGPPGQSRPPQPAQPAPSWPPAGQPPAGYPPVGYPGGYYPPPRQTSGKAILALVLGVCSLSLGPFTGIPAIIVGISAKREIDASRGMLEGRGLAQAGFVLGLVLTILTVLAVIGLVLLAVVVASVDTTSGSGDFLITG